MGEVTGTSDITNHIIGTHGVIVQHQTTVQGHQFCATFSSATLSEGGSGWNELVKRMAEKIKGYCAVINLLKIPEDI